MRGNGKNKDAVGTALIAYLVERLATEIRENAQNHERARRAEARANDLMADLMRQQLAEDGATLLPKAG